MSEGRNSVAPGRNSQPPRTSVSPTILPACHKAIKDIIAKNTVVIFGKTWCPFCQKAKKLFDEIGEPFGNMDLDILENGMSFQRALREMTGQKTVPYIFVNQMLVGGFTDIVPKVEAGILSSIIAGEQVDFEFDLVVIGGGSGGIALAKEAAKFGKNVALCDFVVPTPLGTRWGLGGTCVNVGCIPKKLMHRAANLRQDLNDASDFGWEIKDIPVHKWGVMVANVQNYIKSLNFGYRKTLLEEKIKYFNFLASFVDKNTLKLKNDQDEKTVKSTNIVIAVGCRPKYPDIPNAKELCITSDDLFSMSTPPGRTLIIGGGYVALECAGFLSGLGFKTTVMVRSILLRGFDQQMAEKIEKHMTACGIIFVKNYIPTEFEKDKKLAAVRVKAKDSEGNEFSDVFKTVVLAIGREPCTDYLNLQAVGISINKNTKKIITDSKERTSISNIFAIGDVADGKMELTPVAIQAGKLLAQRLYNLKTTIMNYTNIPTTVFTPCEYACVGYTEDDAINQHPNKIEVYHQQFSYLESVLNSNPKYHTNGYVKLIVLKDGKEERVIGCHVFSPNAGEIIQGFALAVKMQATKKQFDELVGIHPTIAEVLTSLDITKSSGKNVEVTGC